MIITGSALFVESGSSEEVKEALSAFPEVTFHGESRSSQQIVITIEADGIRDLDRICSQMADEIPEIIDIAHLYVNFEDEVEKIRGRADRENSADSPTYWE